MKKVLIVFSKIISVIAIITGAYGIFINIVGVAAIFTVKYLETSLSGKIFYVLIALIYLFNPICVLASGILLIKKFTPNVFIPIYLSLGLICVNFIAPSIGIGKAGVGYYSRTFANHLPIIIIDLLLLTICFILQKSNKERLIPGG